MSLYAVQTLIKETLQGLETPQDLLPPADCFIAPPVSDEIDKPKIYVWGSTDDEMRQTAGRTSGGAKKIVTDVHIWYYWVQAPDWDERDAAFPALVWAIRNAMRRVPVVQTLNDPISGEVSQLLAIGERMQNIQGTPNLLEDQRYLWYSGRLTCRVEEYVQA